MSTHPAHVLLGKFSGLGMTRRGRPISRRSRLRALLQSGGVGAPSGFNKARKARQNIGLARETRHARAARGQLCLKPSQHQRRGWPGRCPAMTDGSGERRCWEARPRHADRRGRAQPQPSASPTLNRCRRPRRDGRGWHSCRTASD